MMHYSEDELYTYIEGKTYPKDIQSEIKAHLKDCLECYQRYIDLKEIKYFCEEGEAMPENVLNNIVSLVGQGKSKRISLIIYYTKRTLRVFSEDNSELKTSFLDVSYAYRNGKEVVNNNDKFVVEKTISQWLKKYKSEINKRLKIMCRKQKKTMPKTLTFFR